MTHRNTVLKISYSSYTSFSCRESLQRWWSLKGSHCFLSFHGDILTELGLHYRTSKMLINRLFHQYHGSILNWFSYLTTSNFKSPTGQAGKRFQRNNPKTFQAIGLNLFQVSYYPAETQITLQWTAVGCLQHKVIGFTWFNLDNKCTHFLKLTSAELDKLDKPQLAATSTWLASWWRKFKSWSEATRLAKPLESNK